METEQASSIVEAFKASEAGAQDLNQCLIGDHSVVGRFTRASVALFSLHLEPLYEGPYMQDQITHEEAFSIAVGTLNFFNAMVEAYQALTEQKRMNVERGFGKIC